jgi:hypothetical protein
MNPLANIFLALALALYNLLLFALRVLTGREWKNERGKDL